MSVTVRRLLEPALGLQLSLLNSADWLENAIDSDQVQKSGLAMTGYTKYLYPGWLQVLGNSELAYLRTLPADRREEILRAFCEVDIPAIAVTRGLQPPDGLQALCDARRIALLTTPLLTAEFIQRVQRSLEVLLAPTTSLHGVLIDVFGVGVLLIGHSGIGKSECALDLVMRGHKLVADDIVDIVRRGGVLVGKGYELIKYHMEIRGLGIINLKDLFGVAAVRDSKKIELCIELVDWDEDVEYDRLGIEERTYSILGVEVPNRLIPVRPGRNVSVLVEVAARNQLLRSQGRHSAAEFQERLMKRIAEQGHGGQSTEGVE
jgi:HPr kinase/phosphorylase